MESVALEVSLRFQGRLEYLRLVSATSRFVCNMLPPPHRNEEFADGVELAVTEACANAIKHGRAPGGADEVRVVFQVTEEVLEIRIEDYGPGFTMDHLCPPDFRSHPEGGYGVYIMRTIMDSVKYEKGVPNCLIMKKSLDSKA